MASEATEPDDAGVLAVGSVLPELPDWFGRDPTPATRATRQDRLEGEGHGHAPGPEGLGHSGAGSSAPCSTTSGSQGGGLVWCTARIGASTFYGRAGFVARGDRNMSRASAPTGRCGSRSGRRLSETGMYLRGRLAPRRAVTMWGSPTGRLEPPTFPVP